MGARYRIYILVELQMFLDFCKMYYKLPQFTTELPETMQNMYCIFQYILKSTPTVCKMRYSPVFCVILKG